MLLSDKERLDIVNDNLSLIQNTEGLTFGTDALLLAGYVTGKHSRMLELGAGTGIISMLLLTRGKAERVTALEIQEEYAALIERNSVLNSLTDSLTVINTDLRDYKCSSEYDAVFTNPPYMRSDTGRSNLSDKKTVARHEVHGGIYDFLKCAARALRFGGSFYAVYRTDRLIDLIDAMRKTGIEPKRMTFVHADAKSEPSMALIEGRRGGKCSLKVTRPLIIYTSEEHKDYTEDMNYIMNEGSFGKEYGIGNGRK